MSHVRLHTAEYFHVSVLVLVNAFNSVSYLVLEVSVKFGIDAAQINWSAFLLQLISSYIDCVYFLTS